MPKAIYNHVMLLNINYARAMTSANELEMRRGRTTWKDLPHELWVPVVSAVILCDDSELFLNRS